MSNSMRCAKAAARGELLIREELRRIEEDFTGHSARFYAGAYSPYVEFDPPLAAFQEARVGEFEFIQFERSDPEVAAKTQYRRLKDSLKRMGKIAECVEDVWRRDLGFIVSWQEIHVGGLFKVMDHGEKKGVQVRFLYNGDDG